MSPLNDEAAKKYDEERRRADTSPAQPPDETRIDDDGPASNERGESHAHVKDDDAHRMEN